jgi:hypothetical protein
MLTINYSMIYIVEINNEMYILALIILKIFLSKFFCHFFIDFFGIIFFW